MKIVSDNPFYFFEFLIEQNGIYKWYESFLTDAKMLDGWFVNEDKSEFKYAELDNWGQKSIITETFATKLNSKFIKAYNHFVVMASENVGSTKDIKAKKELLLFYLDSIQHLKSISINIELYVDIQKYWLLKAANYLSEKYERIIPDHAVFNQIDKEDESFGYFGFFGGRMDLENIYNKLVQLNLFSEEEVSFNQFRNVIFSEVPQDLNFKIRLTCKLQEAAIIFANIQQHFINLTIKSIVESKCFLTLQGNPLTEGSLYTQRSKIKSNLLKQDRLQEIQNHLQIIRITKR